jgi:hypothetical protein
MSLGVSDAISMVTLIRQVYRNRRIIGALFDWQGKRLEGDERLEVEVHYAYGKPEAGSDYWWYSVKPFDDYLFVRMPVNPGGVAEAVDKAEGQDLIAQAPKSTDARYFRYVQANPLKEWVNVRVGFMVFAYKPSDLLSVSKHD